ncbi:zinc-ribbon domain-containing protein [bacterium]|nr:zinc-ribbon domain-containing protein [bacterium]
MMEKKTLEKNKECKCPQCGKVAGEDDEFCSECDIEFWSCYSCGALILENATNCPECGEDLESFVCAKCGSKVSKDNKFCPQCGIRVGKYLEEEEENKLARIPRPIGVSVLSIVVLIVGIVGSVAGIGLLLPGTRGFSSVRPGFFIIGLGIITILLALSIRAGEAWARTVILIFSWFYGVVGIIGVLGIISGHPHSPIGVIVALWLGLPILSLSTHKAKVYFGIKKEWEK